MPKFDASFGKAVAVPVHHFAGTFGKRKVETLVDMAAGRLGGKGDEVKLVDVGTPLLLVAGSDGGKAFAYAGADDKSIDADHLGSALGGAGNGKHAAGAASDNEDFGFDGLDNVLLVDDRRLAEPVAGLGRFFSRLFSNDFNGNLALSLFNALAGRTRNGVGGHRSAGNGIDFGTLRGEKGLLELFGSGLADGRRFTRRINHDVNDAVGFKSHADADITGDAGSLGSIGAGFVKARRSGVNGGGSQGGTAGKACAKQLAPRKVLRHLVSPV